LKTETVTEGGAATAPANPSRTGYEFKGWDKAFNNITANTTVNATWDEYSYTIKFDANTGTGNMPNQSFTYSEQKALTKNTFTKDGYSFKNWNTMPDGSGISYTDAQTLKSVSAINNHTITLYAQWQANAAPTPSYTIHFDANTGTGNMSNQTYNLDQSTALPANGFTKDGYSFKNWNTIPDGSGISYGDRQEINNLASANQTITLYAIWEKNPDPVIPDDPAPVDPAPEEPTNPANPEPTETPANPKAIDNPKTAAEHLPAIIATPTILLGLTATGYHFLRKRR
ncbi:InlB B-repeat-containing protein, partial [Candidatus Saccharibacteria bacterium]|nr:InlB B-repeat-containing protein [Candidatus Saccharibacteria bacterium]